MKVCFIGSGSIGKRHIRNLIQIGKEDKVDYEIHLLRATDSSLPVDIQCAVNRICRTPNELENKYDAIFITNPTHLHYKAILEMKDKAQYFFVEKPLFDTLNYDIVSMKLPAENIYYVACPLRYTQVLKFAEDFLRKNRPFSIRAISSSYLPDWRPGTDYRNTYSAHKSQGGGVSIDLIHEWDYISHLFGFPEEVMKLSGKFSNLEIDSEDLAVYIARYKEFLVELHLDYFGKKIERKVEMFCSGGKYVFDIAGSAVFKDGNKIIQFNEEANDKYLNEMRFFLSLKNGVINTNDLQHAFNVQKITS